MSTGTMLVAVATWRTVPVLRAKRGWAPPDSCRRSRWPAPNRCAVELIGTSMSLQPSSSVARLSSRRSRPSQTFHDLPFSSTSHSRANTSKYGWLPRTRSRMPTGPMTSTGSASGSLV
jgi:hypothetical protein